MKNAELKSLTDEAAVYSLEQLKYMYDCKRMSQKED